MVGGGVGAVDGGRGVDVGRVRVTTAGGRSRQATGAQAAVGEAGR